MVNFEGSTQRNFEIDSGDRDGVEWNLHVEHGVENGVNAQCGWSLS